MQWILLQKYANIILLILFERMMVMALAKVTKTTEPSYTVNDAMDVLLGKLDKAIDDMERGRVQTIEEAWEEIDRV